MISLIVGWVLGIFSTLAIEWWKALGHVSFYDRYFWKRGSPDSENAESLVVEVWLRIMNSFPVEKTLAVDSVKYFGEDKTKPLFEDRFPKIGESPDNLRSDKDLYLPANSFTRLRIVSHTPSPEDKPIPKDVLHGLRWVSVTTTVLPDESVTRWYDLQTALDLYDAKNDDLLRATYH